MVHRIQQIQQHFPLQVPNKTKSKSDVNFSDILSGAQKIKIKKNAKQQLTERQMKINDTVWQKIGKNMSEAKEKGITESLVVTNEEA